MSSAKSGSRSAKQPTTETVDQAKKQRKQELRTDPTKYSYDAVASNVAMAAWEKEACTSQRAVFRTLGVLPHLPWLSNILRSPEPLSVALAQFRGAVLDTSTWAFLEVRYIPFSTMSISMACNGDDVTGRHLVFCAGCARCVWFRRDSLRVGMAWIGAT